MNGKPRETNLTVCRFFSFIFLFFRQTMKRLLFPLRSQKPFFRLKLTFQKRVSHPKAQNAVEKVFIRKYTPGVQETVLVIS